MKIKLYSFLNDKNTKTYDIYKKMQESNDSERKIIINYLYDINEYGIVRALSHIYDIDNYKDFRKKNYVSKIYIVYYIINIVK